MKSKVVVFILGIFVCFIFCSQIRSWAQVFETPLEIHVQTQHFNISIWKKEILGGRIDIYDKDTIIKVFPFFYFGSNSANNQKVGLFNQNNGYKMFLGPVSEYKIIEKDRVTIIELIYSKAVTVFDGSKTIKGEIPGNNVFSGKSIITIYHDEPRIDIFATEYIRETLYTHISWFSNINISDAQTIKIGAEDGFVTEFEPWSKLKFMTLSQDEEALFKQCDHDEKPPFTTLGKKAQFDDKIFMSNDNATYMFNMPSWKKYASLDTNRKNIPDNSMLFHKTGSKSARVIFITKDTTLASGRDVLTVGPGVYENLISIRKINE
jgi:hypothetical protein